MPMSSLLQAAPRIFVVINPFGFYLFAQASVRCSLGGNIQWPGALTIPGLRDQKPAIFHCSVCLLLWIQQLQKIIPKRTGYKSVGTSANLVLAAAAGACTAIITQVNPLSKSFALLVFSFHLYEHTDVN